jgi:P27 family predicted phage terminase small subunit
MAKTGPKPTPTRLKRLKGNPGKRPLPKNEPQPDKPARVPMAPRHLDKIAKKEWRRMARELHKLGLLTALDTTALAGYCVAYSTWVMATEKIQKHGVLIKTPNGYPVQSPFLQIANRAASEMRTWLVEFGMTPSSRSRVTVEPKEDKDPFEEFLKQGGKPRRVK